MASERDTAAEAVHHPAHYGGADNPYEVIKVIEAWELLPGEQSEPFKLYANYSRQFEVRLIDREVHVIARSLNTDSFTRAVAEGFARCCAEAWKTEMRNG